MAYRISIGLSALVLCVSLSGIAAGGVVKLRYADDNPVYDSYVFGQDTFVRFTPGNVTNTASYGDRVRLRVTRLSGEDDRSRADSLTITARVGSGDLPLILEWLLAAEWSSATHDTSRVTVVSSLLDARFVWGSRSDSKPASFLLSVVAVDSSEVLRASRRERAVRKAIADYRAGREEDAALALRAEAATGKLPTLARCVYLGALERTGRCRAYAREQTELARSGIGNEAPESLIVARCQRASASLSSEGDKFRAQAPARSFDDWFLGDQTFVEAQVIAVRDSATTNLNPPRVTFEIDRVLRGDSPGRVVTVSWPGFLSPHDRPDYVPNHARRDWYPKPRRGPTVGAHFVFGLSSNDRGEWTSDPLLRWSPAEADEQDVRERIAATTPQVEARHERERPAKEEARRIAEAKRAAEEAERSRIARTRAAEERAARNHASIAELVRMSDVIVVSPALVPSGRRPPWGRLGGLKPKRWLRTPGGAPPPENVEVLFGAREDTLCGRWLAMTRESESADSLECVAFLRDAHDVRPGQWRQPLYRPADPVAGLLRADDGLIREVLAALAERGDAPTEPAIACGASLDEFRQLDDIALADVAVKLSSVARPSGWSEPGTLILSCATSPAPSTGWFIPCTTPSAPYHVDYETEPEVVILPFESMRAMIAALRSVPEIARGRVDPSDQLTVSLRGPLHGEERIFEATLNGAASSALSRRLAATFAAPGEAHVAFQAFWGLAAGSTAPAWSREPSFQPPSRLRPGTGAVVGTVVFGASSVPVVSATIRASVPDRNVRTDQKGAFAMLDLPGGPRWIEFYGDGYRPQYKMVDVTEDSITTVVLRLGNAPANVGQTAVPPMRRWRIDVRDDRDHAVPGAYVAIADSSTMSAGLSDAHGRIEFIDPVNEGAFLFVRAAGMKPFRTPFGSKESVLVRISRR